MEQQPNRTYERTKSNQKQNQVTRHIQIDHVLYFSIQPTKHAVVSLKDGFTVWRQVKRKFFVNNILI